MLPGKKMWITALVGTLLASCATLQSVSLTPIPKTRAHQAEAKVDKWVILGFNFDNDFINALPQQLRAQCPQGKVTGILTKHYVVSYLLVHKIVVNANGFCVKG